MFGFHEVGEMKRLLILEDEPDVAKAMKMLLESKGYSVDYTFKAEDALATMEKYDLLLLDLILSPHTSGRKVLAEMKSRGIKTQVIVVSAVTLPRMVADELSNSYPDVDFVSKLNMHTDLVPAIEKKLG